MLHYFAKDFFAPIIVTGHVTNAGQLDFYVISDLTSSVYNATVDVNVFAWNSLIPVASEQIQTDIVSLFYGVSQKLSFKLKQVLH